MIRFRVLFLIVLLAMSFGAIAAGQVSLPDASIGPVKRENPDVEVTATLCQDSLFGNPFEIENPYVFRTGESIRLCLTLHNLESDAKVPLRRDLANWYQDLRMSLTVREGSDYSQPIPALIAVAKEVPRGLGKSEEFLSPRASSVASFEIQLPDVRRISKSRRVQVTVDCHVDLSAVGIVIPKDSGKTKGGATFQIQLEMTNKDEDIVAYRKAANMMLGGDTERAMSVFQALAKKYPEADGIQGMIAHCYYRAGKLREALGAYKVLVRMLQGSQPKNSWALDLKEQMLGNTVVFIEKIEQEIRAREKKGELVP